MQVKNKAKLIARAREIAEKADGEWLAKRGWIRNGKEWRHRNLVWTWPTTAARRLQEETDKGVMDPAHRLLRGSDRPT